MQCEKLFYIFYFIINTYFFQTDRENMIRTVFCLYEMNGWTRRTLLFFLYFESFIILTRQDLNSQTFVIFIVCKSEIRMKSERI